LILTETSGFGFGLPVEKLDFIKIVSITERISASNIETHSGYGNKNNKNSTLFNPTAHSDELN
jgi:hypothetical protein